MSSWDELAVLAEGCVACPELAATRQHVVFGQRPAAGPPYDLVLLGEAPGAEEDASGQPFVGRSGQLLDLLLAEAGLPRPTVGVVNVVKCRPPGNRKPARVEVSNCRGWLDQQLALLDPLLILTLGATATEAMLGRGARLTQLRGREHVVDGRVVVATYHPSAAIRFGPRGAPRAALVEDLAYVARRLTELRTEREWFVNIPDAYAMQAWGARLAALLAPGDLVLLSGPLGAGKTTLAQGIGIGLGVAGPVVSPTFVIARIYRGGRLPMVHVDAYRLGGVDEVDDLDLDASVAESVTIVEWGDGLVESLAENRLEVRIDRPLGLPEEDDEDDTRTVEVMGVGPRWQGVALD